MPVQKATSDVQPSYQLGVLANPASGRHERTLGRWPPPNDVPMHMAQTFEEVGHALTKLAAQNVTLLAIAGGDGTVRNALTHILLGDLFPKLPIIALVASGSTNMTGHDTGIIDLGQHGWDALLQFAETPTHGTGRLTRRSVLRIQPDPSDPAFCGMLFGTGAINHAVRYTQSHLHSVGLRGSVGPAIAFARFLKALATKDYRHFQPVALRATDDQGHFFDDSTLLFVATTLDRLLLHFRPFWGTGDGAIAWSAVAGNARGLLRRLPGAAWGRPGPRTIPANGFKSERADSITLEFDGGFIVDGEHFVASEARGPVELSIAGTLDFISF